MDEMEIDTTRKEEEVKVKKRKGKKRAVEKMDQDPTTTESATVEKKSKLVEMRKVQVPSHRYTPLKDNWMKIYTPIVENLDLQVRFNLKTRNVEIREGSKGEAPPGYLQKAEDFVRAFIYGYEVEDAMALIRLEDLFIDTFDVKDVKMLNGDHLSRAIGRIAGKGGRTKYTIENSTMTRIVLADSRVHILGSYSNIQLAKRALCNLILGAPPSKVYGTLRSMATKASF